ncbi:MAG: putative gamma-butyrobetaine hydroxylase [Gammaproteobacteria bacterium]|nr:putative gamma-butyrobetaine hydroxylase [Gammaproteobacteria bacterium]
MSSKRRIKLISALPELLTVEWADGDVAEFASIWLRDNLREDRDPHNGQRLVDIADLPPQPRIRSAKALEDSVQIEWEAESTLASFDLDWLSAQAANAASKHPERVITTWLGSDLQAERDFAWATFDELRLEPAVKLRWLTRLLQTGIAFLSAVPSTDAAILDAMALVGRVCETNYGLVFDVRSVPQPENLAYSDLGLELHTDNPYREPVPGFQALHAVLASPDGGQSVFADGFALGNRLRDIDPDAFSMLTQTPVPFHYRSKDAELYAERPLLQLSCCGEISAVHYNNRSIAPLRDSGREAARFYTAYRRFATLLRDPTYHLKFRLGNGDLVLFDNQRILHGRTAFSSAKHGRHLRGCYLSRDGVYSQAALLRRKLVNEVSP